MGTHCVHMYFDTYLKKILSPKAFLNHVDILPTVFLASVLVLIAESYRSQKLWTAKINMRNSWLYNAPKLQIQEAESETCSV